MPLLALLAALVMWVALFEWPWAAAVEVLALAVLTEDMLAHLEGGA